MSVVFIVPENFSLDKYMVVVGEISDNGGECYIRLCEISYPKIFRLIFYIASIKD